MDAFKAGTSSGLPVSETVFADGARWAITVVFALSLAEKVIVLGERRAGWHPLILARAWRRRHAHALIAAAAVLDLSACLLLGLEPAAGGWLAVALLLVYTVVALGAHGGSEPPGSCQCFWRVLDVETKRGLIVRNSLLGCLAAAAAVAGLLPSMTGGLAALGFVAVVWALAWATVPEMDARGRIAVYAPSRG